MSPSTTQVRQGRSIGGTIALTLTAAVVMIGISMGPALGQDHERRFGPPERNQRAYQSPRRAHQPPKRAHQPYGYYAPPPVIYAPPPVVYAPPPSPGISLFFDFPIRIR